MLCCPTLLPLSFSSRLLRGLSRSLSSRAPSIMSSLRKATRQISRWQVLRAAFCILTVVHTFGTLVSEAEDHLPAPKYNQVSCWCIIPYNGIPRKGNCAHEALTAWVKSRSFPRVKNERDCDWVVAGVPTALSSNPAEIYDVQHDWPYKPTLAEDT